MTTLCRVPCKLWHLAYVLAGFIHNCLPNFRCKTSPYEVLCGGLPQFGLIYPFGTHIIVHIPLPQQSSKLDEHGWEAYLLHPLLEGAGWLFWITGLQHFVHSASATLPNYQASLPAPWREKGHLQHIVNNLSLCLVYTDGICFCEDEVANSIPHITCPMLPKLYLEEMRSAKASDLKELCLSEL
ncbi:hypothetical protein O181_018586 [Austropuccinia psidii MF-1]|uniref:Uncharacterized protein n=1 Tax=Austropuccinia psidii MF-1 TaxID=1389203 RepID=A0A9Q3GT31_9BASI|nr:hypothetical protein [Austropuccinia psidii MF-1]